MNLTLVEIVGGKAIVSSPKSVFFVFFIPMGEDVKVMAVESAVDAELSFTCLPTDEFVEEATKVIKRKLGEKS